MNRSDTTTIKHAMSTLILLLTSPDENTVGIKYKRLVKMLIYGHGHEHWIVYHDFHNSSLNTNVGSDSNHSSIQYACSDHSNTNIFLMDLLCIMPNCHWFLHYCTSLKGVLLTIDISSNIKQVYTTYMCHSP